MPLTGTESVYAAALKAALLADPDSAAVDNPALDALCNAVSTTIIPHIIANALLVVAAGIPVATAGGPAAQTGATTAPGTGTIT